MSSYSVQLSFNDGLSWSQDTSCAVKGHIFDSAGRCRHEKTLMDYYSSCSTIDEFIQRLHESNGQFAVLVKNDTELYAAVDRIRSIPLFYGIRQDTFYLSDDAHWVSKQIDGKYHPQSKAEFLLCGYVTGPETLCRGVMQIQAGECIHVSYGNKKSPAVRQHRYYRYLHTNYHNLSEKDLEEKLHSVVSRTFQRVVDYADGRPLIIPLSGGYDSRLIATTLKRLNYSNLISFNYGKPGENQTRKISEWTAGKLGIPWIFIPYSNRKWAGWYHSSEMETYRKRASGLCAVAHIQDWPAVLELKEKNLIPEDSIFIPGLSADLLAGSRSRVLTDLYEGPLDINNVIQAVFHYHYCLLHELPLFEKNSSFFLEKIHNSLEPIDAFQESAGAFESWDISERQAKYINNSLRVYEYWGYEWLTPYWDNEFMDFWSSVSTEGRINKSLYDRYVSSMFESVAKVPRQVSSRRDGTRSLPAEALVRCLNTIGIYKKLLGVRETYRNMKATYSNHHLNLYGIMPKKTYHVLKNISPSPVIFYEALFQLNLLTEMKEDLLSSIKNIFHEYVHSEYSSVTKDTP
ncbi:MAG: hypothetical protein JXM72_04870 [Deltaproteobacteria bacterium]|nr:hypothetical protein [Deltaproteobacteria bacterium]